MGPLRVGVLAPEDSTLPAPAGAGGITGTVSELVRRLAQRCDVVVGAAGDPAAACTHDGVRYAYASTRRDARRATAVELANKVERRLRLSDVPYVARADYFSRYAATHARTFRDANVDTVLLYNVVQWLPTLRHALPRARLVLYMHSEWLAELPYAETCTRLRLADRVLGVSQQIAAQIRARFPGLADVVDVVGNGIDADVFAPGPAATALRQRLGLADGPIILFVGRLSAEKGLHTLLEAVPRLLDSAPQATVVLAGAPVGLRSPLATRDRPELHGHPEWRTRYIDHLRQLAVPFGAHVRFAGTVGRADLPALYRLADVYVQPSVFESFGLPVAEAMACGRPVVASRAGALPELVEHRLTGVLVSPGDPAALAEAIAGLLRDRPLADRLGAAARRRAASLDWDTAAEQLYRALAA